MPFGPPVIARGNLVVHDYRQRRIGFGRGLPRRASRRPAACCRQQRQPRHVEIASDDAEARFRRLSDIGSPMRPSPMRAIVLMTLSNLAGGHNHWDFSEAISRGLGRDLKPGVNLARDDVSSTRAKCPAPGTIARRDPGMRSAISRCTSTLQSWSSAPQRMRGRDGNLAQARAAVGARDRNLALLTKRVESDGRRHRPDSALDSSFAAASLET